MGIASVNLIGQRHLYAHFVNSLARLFRETGESRYLAMAEEVLKDFEAGGDYFRQGLEGKEFYRTPRPRWESLHSLQGMVELYRIGGDRRLAQSFLHQRASIRRFDMRNTGGFSSAERATGNPYRNDAIETCCVIAWQPADEVTLRFDMSLRYEAGDLDQFGAASLYRGPIRRSAFPCQSAFGGGGARAV